LTTLLDFTPQTFDADDVMTLHAAAKSTKDDILQDAAYIIEREPFYNELMSEFMRTMADNKRYIPELIKLETVLKSASVNDTGLFQKLMESMDLLEKVKPVVRRGTSEPLQTISLDLLEQLITQLWHEESLGDLIDMTIIVEASPCYEKALGMWPDDATMQQAHEWCLHGSKAHREEEKLQKCLALCDSCISASASLVEESLPELLLMLEEPGLVAMDEITESIATFVEKLMTGLQMKGTAATSELTISRLATNMLRPSSRKSLLESCMDTMDKASSLTAKMDAFVALGVDAGSRVDADADKLHLGALLRARVVGNQHLESRSSDTDPETMRFLSAQVEKADGIVLEAKNIWTARSKAALDRNLADAKLWSGGVGDGTAWSSELADDADMAVVIEVAKKALLKNQKCSIYLQTAHSLMRNLKMYRQACDFFEMPFESTIEQTVYDTWKESTVRYYEGMSLTAFEAKLSALDLRSKVQALQKKMTGEKANHDSLVWDDLRSSIASRAKAAIMLKKGGGMKL
jgi:hypothetical protein